MSNSVTSLDLGIGNIPPLFEVGEITASAQTVAQLQSSWHYTNHCGLPELREALATELRLNSEDIIVTTGASEAITLTYLVLTRERKKIIIPRLCFPAFRELARLFALEVATYDLQHLNSSDPTEVLTMLNEDIAFVVLNSPLNPTGSVLDRSFVEQVVLRAQSYGISVLCDEAYGSMIYGAETLHSFEPSLLHDSPSVILVRSLGKLFGMSGIRLGYVASRSPRFIAALSDAKLHGAMCSSTHHQAMAFRLLQLPYRERAFARNAQFAENVALLSHELKSVGLHVITPRGGPFICCSSPDYSINLSRRFEELGIQVTPLSYFGGDSSQVRLCIARSDDVIRQVCSLLPQMRFRYL